MKKFIEFIEDAPGCSVGSGNIAGTGVGSAGEPGINQKKKSLIIGNLKRK